jgi:hypothetical protein
MSQQAVRPVVQVRVVVVALGLEVLDFASCVARHRSLYAGLALAGLALIRRLAGLSQ